MISVVVPAYNEEDRLPASLVAIRAWLDAEAEPYEVIVVDDGSRDGTADLVEREARQWPQLRCLRQPANAGKGAAVRAGMLEARGELRLFSDADLSAAMDQLPRLRERLLDRCHVAIASRAVPGAQITVQQPGLRETMGRAYNRLVQLVLLPGIHDTQCGFKLFTAAAAIDAFGPLRTRGFGFDVEVLVRAQRCGHEIAEVPVVWAHKEDSRVSALRDSLRVLIDLVRIRLQRS